MLGIRSRRPIDPVLGKYRLNLIPQCFIDNRLMLSGIGIALVSDLATIDAVLEHQIKGAAGEPLTPNLAAISENPPLAPDTLAIEFGP